MKIAPCRSYHAQSVGFTLLRMPDGKSAFKVYFLSITGRDQPERYEWQHCPRDTFDFERDFAEAGHQGIGFLTVFPHVTKLFRFSPHMETILDVEVYATDGMTRAAALRPDGSQEFSCYAEAVLARDEYAAWAQAETVEDYLAFKSEAQEFPVLHHAKLARYWG